MKLQEYQAKELFAEVGIPTATQYVAESVDEAVAAAQKIGKQVVVKAQVLVGGRGKAGGVKLASSPEEVREKATAILGMDIKGLTVEKLLITEAAEIEHEYYAGLIVDRTSKKVVLMITREGGVDIEELAETDPEKIHKIPFSLEDGLSDALVADVYKDVFQDEVLVKEGKDIVNKLVELFRKSDSSLLEINPLARVNGHLMALDAKMVIDDNAQYRQPEIVKYKNLEEYAKGEEDARENGLSFVSMDGNIGCIVNGAGLAMATMDIIKYYGGEPANFLDVGGSSNPDKVVNAIRIILDNPKVDAILLNIFGGITRCDDIARGLLVALERYTVSVPLVVRLVGTNQTEGRALLEEQGMKVESTLDDAVQAVIRERENR